MPLELDSPYQISKIVGEFYCDYYHARTACRPCSARFQNVYGPGEILGAGAGAARPPPSGATSRRRSSTARSGRRCRSTTAASRAATSSTSTISSTACSRCATKGDAGEVYNLASGAETIDPRAGRDRHTRSTDNPTPIARDPGARLGSLRPRFGSARQGRAPSSSFAAAVGLEEGLEATIEWTRANMDRIETCMARTPTGSPSCGRRSSSRPPNSDDDGRIGSAACPASGNVLVVYRLEEYPLRAAVSDHLLQPLRSYSLTADAFTSNLGLRKVPRHLTGISFDAVVFHTSFLSGRWCRRDCSEELCERAAPLKGLGQDSHRAAPGRVLPHRRRRPLRRGVRYRPWCSRFRRNRNGPSSTRTSIASGFASSATC